MVNNGVWYVRAPPSGRQTFGRQTIGHWTFGHQTIGRPNKKNIEVNFFLT